MYSIYCLKRMEDSKEIIKETNLLLKIRNQIPQEIIDIIFHFISFKVKIFLNKHFYYHYHFYIYDFILSRNKENFIRTILRTDNQFVFQQLLTENYLKWIYDIKNYKYKNFAYKSYIYFLKDFCLFNDSFQCSNLLNEFLEKHNLCQNQHKKNTVRNIRWKI